MNLFTGQNGSQNIGFGGFFGNLILKYRLDTQELMVKARFLVEKAKKQNKTDQEIQRIKKLLTMTEEDLEMKAEVWKEEQIFMFLLVLESETKTGRKIVVKSLERKFGLVKSIFRQRGCPLTELTERKVTMALNVHIKGRLDKSELPTPDRSAPRLSPVQWVKIQKWLSEEPSLENTDNFRNKKYMAMLRISIGFSTGLRLTEIHRLKYSDLDFDGEDEIRIRIRRSKSNRKGDKIVIQVAPAFEAEPLLCPIRNLLNYVEKMDKIMFKGAFIFANDRRGERLTRIENLTTYWRKGAKGAGLPKEQWPQAHSHHNAKINLGRALGYTEEQITDAMNWSSVSVLHQYLRRTNANKEGIAYKITSLTAEELTRQTSHLWS